LKAQNAALMDELAKEIHKYALLMKENQVLTYERDDLKEKLQRQRLRIRIRVWQMMITEGFLEHKFPLSEHEW